MLQIGKYIGPAEANCLTDFKVGHLSATHPLVKGSCGDFQAFGGFRFFEEFVRRGSGQTRRD